MAIQDFNQLFSGLNLNDYNKYFADQHQQALDKILTPNSATGEGVGDPTNIINQFEGENPLYQLDPNMFKFETYAYAQQLKNLNQQQQEDYLNTINSLGLTPNMAMANAFGYPGFEGSGESGDGRYGAPVDLTWYGNNKQADGRWLNQNGFSTADLTKTLVDPSTGRFYNSSVDENFPKQDMRWWQSDSFKGFLASAFSLAYGAIAGAASEGAGTAAGVTAGSEQAGMLAAQNAGFTSAELAAINTGVNSGGWLVGTDGLLGSTGSTVADTFANGALKGGLMSGAQGQDPLTGALSGGMSAGYGAGLGQLGSAASSVAGDYLSNLGSTGSNNMSWLDDISSWFGDSGSTPTDTSGWFTDSAGNSVSSGDLWSQLGVDPGTYPASSSPGLLEQLGIGTDNQTLAPWADAIASGASPDMLTQFLPYISDAATASQIGQYLNAAKNASGATQGTQGANSGSALMKLLGTLGSSALGAYGANQQANSTQALADKYAAMGAPYRQRLADLYSNPASFLSSPSVQVPVQQGTNALARSLSMQGNPVASGNALQELQNYSTNQLYDKLALEKQTLGNLGGLSNFNAAIPQLDANAISQKSNIYNAVGAGLNNIFQPQQSLADILKQAGY